MRFLLLLLLVTSPLGCSQGAFSNGNMRPDPSFSVDPPPPPPVMDADGGIITSGRSIYSGRRAIRVGDHLTVKIAQNTQADSTAGTNLNRNNETSVALQAMLGLETQLEGIGLTPGAMIGGTTKNNFNGDGTTNRTGALTGTLTVQVVEVQSNGNLVIGGRQAIKINNEIQVLSLRGTVDPRAISADNSIASTQIVDARIEFSGVGVVAGKQRPGWLARILDVVSPF